MSTPQGRVLIVAGSDSGGGAGVQADIKTVTALGGYAATAVTAITVQNTLGVSDVHAVPDEIISGQMRAVLDDIGADAIKIGMLGTTGVVHAVAGVLQESAADIPIVLDPVMVAKGGHALLAEDAIAAVRDDLLPLCAVVTPNAPEAGALTGVAVTDAASMRAAADRLIDLGARAALVKGGHLDGETVVDLLVTANGETRFEDARIATRHTHGTGCTLSSAIAAGLAHGKDLVGATTSARAYLLEAIRQAPGFGAGHGPLDHAWPVRGGATPPSCRS